MPSDSSEDEDQENDDCGDDEVKEKVVVAANEEAVVSAKEDEEVDVAGVNIPVSIQLDVVLAKSGGKDLQDKHEKSEPKSIPGNMGRKFLQDKHEKSEPKSVPGSMGRKFLQDKHENTSQSEPKSVPGSMGRKFLQDKHEKTSQSEPKSVPGSMGRKFLQDKHEKTSQSEPKTVEGNNGIKDLKDEQEKTSQREHKTVEGNNGRKDLEDEHEKTSQREPKTAQGSNKDDPKEQDPAGAPNQLSVADSSKRDSSQYNAPKEAIQIKRKDLSKLFFLVLTIFGIMGMFLYTIYDFERLSELKYVQADRKLRQAIKAFPKNPQEYNERQRKDWEAHYWRRFNFRNISITTAALLSSLFLAHWHRQTRVAFQSRKTLQFWMGTLLAGFMATIWGLHLMKADESKPFNLTNLMRQQAKLRGQVYLGMISLAGLMLLLYRQQFHEKRRHSKHRHGHRHKKHYSQKKVHQLLM